MREGEFSRTAGTSRSAPFEVTPPLALGTASAQFHFSTVSMTTQSVTGSV